jgi:hypothetical protein
MANVDLVRTLARELLESEIVLSELRYSDDQPRDDHGRFASGGGGSDDSGGSSKGSGPSSSQVVAAANAGGGTFDPKTGEEPTSGFAVAVPGHTSITPDDEFFAGEPGNEAGNQTYRDWVAANADILSQPNMYVGVWHDTANSEVVLDPSEVFDDKDEAIAAGVDRDQQAIYDISAGVEIPTGGTGGRQETLSDGQAFEAGQRNDRRRA